MVNTAASSTSRKPAILLRLLTTELFYFQAKHARAFQAPHRNRLANSPASPRALAAAIPVPVFSGRSAVADATETVAVIVVAVADVPIAVATALVAETADRIAAVTVGETGGVAEDDLNGGPVAVVDSTVAAAVDLVTVIPADTGIRDVRN